MNYINAQQNVPWVLFFVRPASSRCIGSVKSLLRDIVTIDCMNVLYLLTISYRILYFL